MSRDGGSRAVGTVIEVPMKLTGWWSQKVPNPDDLPIQCARMIDSRSSSDVHACGCEGWMTEAFPVFFLFFLRHLGFGI